MDLTLPKLPDGSSNNYEAESRGFKYSIDSILNRSTSAATFSNPDPRWQLYRSQLQFQYHKHFLLHHHYLQQQQQQQRQQPYPQPDVLKPLDSLREDVVSNQGEAKEETTDDRGQCLGSTEQCPDVPRRLPSSPRRERTDSGHGISRNPEGSDSENETESISGPGCGDAEDAITPPDDNAEATIVDVERTASDVESGMICVYPFMHALQKYKVSSNNR